MRSILLTLLFVSFYDDVMASDFGTTGLLTIPTARHQEDGMVSATIAKNEVANHFNLTYQVLPRVEGTFRYTVFDPDDKSSDFLRDRSWSLKVALLKESFIDPKYP